MTLKEEVQYLVDYIELQKIRLSKKVQLEVNFPNEIPEYHTIAPLILVVFVENAFKHSQGSMMNGKHNFIRFDIKIEDKNVVFQAENTFEENTNIANNIELEKEGIGLHNTLRRLELLYGKTALPQISTDNSVYKVVLNLSLENGKN